MTQRIEALFVGGRPSSGKTTVGLALHAELARRGIAHVFIDADAFGHAWPRPDVEARAFLGALWREHRRLGATRLVFASTFAPLRERALTNIVGADTRLPVILTADDWDITQRMKKADKEELERGRQAEERLEREAPTLVRIGTDIARPKAVANTLLSWVQAHGMFEGDGLLARAYVLAKRGNWDDLLSQWAADPEQALLASRYRKPTSGWTFLHQAAYFGRDDACRELIRWGAPVEAVSTDGMRPADVAEDRRHYGTADLLRHASPGASGLWAPPTRLDLLPSSPLWDEGEERYAEHDMRVAYASRYRTIEAGSRHWVDSFGRTLVGWHGSIDPPLGMDAYPMVPEAENSSGLGDLGIDRHGVPRHLTGRTMLDFWG